MHPLPGINYPYDKGCPHATPVHLKAGNAAYAKSIYMPGKENNCPLSILNGLLFQSALQIAATGNFLETFWPFVESWPRAIEQTKFTVCSSTASLVSTSWDGPLQK